MYHSVRNLVAYKHSSWCILNRIIKRGLGNSGPTEATGLFGNPALNSPNGFRIAAERAIKEAKDLVKCICAPTPLPPVKLIEKFDELSDTLCRVADLAECIRQVHPDSTQRAAAQDASISLNSYVEELNTQPSLYLALAHVVKSADFDSFDQSTKRTAESLMHDFEISGIHLQEAQRTQFVDLSQQILDLSYKFLHNTSQPVVVPEAACPPFLRSAFAVDSGNVIVDDVPHLHKDSRVRGLAYLLYYGTFPEQQEVLETLLALRHRLAVLVGSQTYAHRILKSTMAETPETVERFLRAVNARLLPLAKEEAGRMCQLKSTLRDQAEPDVLRPWDVAYINSKAQKQRSTGAAGSGAKQYFAVDTCLDGLDHLFRSLFGVRMQREGIRQGEVWDPLVQKVSFVHESEGLLGYVYLDLYAREGKLMSDCHFMIQGGRLRSDGTYQVPVITLCCSFRPPGGASQPSLLSPQSVENLFHEMGHALHSMVGRSRYQNVTGTRCSTDFAEVPSILMEHFLADERVMRSFARHHQTAEAIPLEAMREVQEASNGFFPSFDAQMQLLYAAMDQRFHGRHPLGQSSVRLFAELHDEFSPLPYVQDTAWFLRFNHLYGYGGKYYSYMWARAVASLIWGSCFRDDPFSRERGERYKAMLRPGGGEHPRTLVAELLGFSPSVDDLVESLCSDVQARRQRSGAKLLTAT
ncbi:hypothetical protein EMCRGX_G008946 [Ephydatia muelleri]|eukprot:Em0003g290a